MGFNSPFKGLIKLEFYRQIFEKYMSNFMKIRPGTVKLYHADGWTDKQTDVMKLMIAFRIFFSNAPRISYFSKFVF